MDREAVKEETIRLVKMYVPELQDMELTEDSVVNKDMGIDSMNFILVVCQLEEHFNVRIPHEEWDTFKTLGELVDAVIRYEGTGAEAEG
ncbi:phosphopantetheine-binding protein [Curtanaerobium respiraculi]|uniref:phosphopantetheine-binding protein n=1 Tax=Curtanaerobium respiraculi TaxID=2949669 RepID=UPI0024B349A9|nr:phosphopantetheine-binding protein [Curtanaerobium respiraculi]